MNFHPKLIFVCHTFRRAGVSAALLGLLSVALVGCGGSGAGGTTLKGAVSYKGAPVTSGVINFVKSGDRPLGGGIKPDGTYEFELPPGDYQVLINAPAPLPPDWKEGDPLPRKPPLVPENFSSFGTSGLTVTVGPESPQQHDITLP